MCDAHKSATYSIEVYFLQNFNNYNMHLLQNFKRHYMTQRIPTAITAIITHTTSLPLTKAPRMS